MPTKEIIMISLYNTSARKRLTNLSINSDLLNKAKQLDINLSATLEQALTEKLRLQLQQIWREQNRESIAAYNDRVEMEGVFNDELRSF
jgi:antitoxin CcdA